MAELKTKKTGVKVSDFLATVKDKQQRDDCRRLATMMRRAAGKPGRMWGPSIVGFGDCHYRYETGREAGWFLLGFSPRKGQLSLYLMGGVNPKAPAMKRLGRHKAGKGCLYVKRLDDVDEAVLQQLLEESVARTRERFGP